MLIFSRDDTHSSARRHEACGDTVAALLDNQHFGMNASQQRFIRTILAGEHRNLSAQPINERLLTIGARLPTEVSFGPLEDNTEKTFGLTSMEVAKLHSPHDSVGGL